MSDWIDIDALARMQASRRTGQYNQHYLAYQRDQREQGLARYDAAHQRDRRVIEGVKRANRHARYKLDLIQEIPEGHIADIVTRTSDGKCPNTGLAHNLTRSSNSNIVWDRVTQRWIGATHAPAPTLSKPAPGPTTRTKRHWTLEGNRQAGGK